MGSVCDLKFTFACLSAGIPEDPLTAEAYYNEDVFESCSEEEDDEADLNDEDESSESEAYDTVGITYGQVGQVSDR